MNGLQGNSILRIDIAWRLGILREDDKDNFLTNKIDLESPNYQFTEYNNFLEAHSFLLIKSN